MPIFFRTMPVREPFTFDSVGNRWKQERIIRPRGYPHYHYLQTEQGRGRIEIQGRTYHLDVGEGVLIAPFVSHSYGGETEEWFTSFATVTGKMESSISGILENRQVIFTEKGQGERMGQLIDQAVKQYETQNPEGKALSVICYRFLLSFLEGISGNEMTKNPLYQKYVLPVIKEIESNYSSSLTAAELSSHVYVTPQYLSRLFRRFLGCSVYEYLTAYRITRAKELLIQSNSMEIQHIAHLTGFEDASHFSAMFRKMTGVTPHDFRGN